MARGRPSDAGRTFGVRLGTVTTVVSEPSNYERKALAAIGALPAGERPVFIVLSSQSRASETYYDVPYYRMKRLLLEQGYPSQMVNEDPEYRSTGVPWYRSTPLLQYYLRS